MKILKIKENKDNIEFEVQLDEKFWNNAREQALKKLAAKVKIQGFRQGKVPVEMAKSVIAETSIIQKALELSNSDVIKAIIDSKEYEESPALERVVNQKVVDFKDKTPILLIAFEVLPKVKNFTLDDVKTLEIPKFEPKKMDDKMVENQVKLFFKEDAMISDKKVNKIETGDLAIIDFEGFIDDKPFQGGKGQDFELEIGSKSFIDNFEEQLIGHKINDKIEVNATFPKDYHAKEYANKKALFKVTIKGIKTIQLPEINEAYLKSKHIKNAKTKDDLAKYVKNIFLDEQKIKYRDEIARTLNEKILSKAKIDNIPESLAVNYKRQILNQYYQEAAKNKMSLDAYLKKLKISHEQLMTIIEKNAANNVLVALVYENLMEELKLDVTKNDIDDFIDKLTRYLKDEKRAKEMFEKHKDEHEALILKDKLLDKIAAIAKIK